MLILEIGRFGDNVEDLKPSDFKDVIPQPLRKSNVGIFWHIKDNQYIVLSTNVLDDTLACVEMGQDYDFEANPDDLQIDYNLFHKEVWGTLVTVEHPELALYEYDTFSRGRILYETQKEKFTIFGPKDIVSHKNVVDFLANQFNIPAGQYNVNSTIYKNKKDVKTIDSSSQPRLYVGP